MYATAVVNEDLCTGCKLCIFACPDPNVIQLKSNKKVAIREGRCKGCGLCASVCAKAAIKIEGA